MFFSIVLFMLQTWTCLWLYTFIVAQDDSRILTPAEYDNLNKKHSHGTVGYFEHFSNSLLHIRWGFQDKSIGLVAECLRALQSHLWVSALWLYPITFLHKFSAGRWDEQLKLCKWLIPQCGCGTTALYCKKYCKNSLILCRKVMSWSLDHFILLSF